MKVVGGHLNAAIVGNALRLGGAQRHGVRRPRIQDQGRAEEPAGFRRAT